MRPVLLRQGALMLCLALLGHSIYAAPPQPSVGGLAEPHAGKAQSAYQPSTTQTPSPRGYALSPELTARAVAHARAAHQLYFLHFTYSVLILLLLLRFRVAPRFRDWAEGAENNRFWQTASFVVALRLTLDAMSLPADVASYSLQRHFGRLVQGWGSWLWDQAKGDLISVIAEIFLVSMLFAVIRRARHWWLYVWLGSLPLIVFSVAASPVLIDPLFHRFTPLAASHPELAKQIERLVVRSGQHIPENRIFLMDASRKINELNANVVGLGASERVVVWDTIVARMTTPEILIVFGHEMGHYVLKHVFIQIAFSAALLLVALWLGFYVFRSVVSRYGAVLDLRGMDDLASLPLLFLLLLLFSFAFTPVTNAVVRHMEREADRYGLEVVQGIVPDSAAVAAETFKILGEVNLEEPSPSWLAQVWFFDHPPIDERIRFAYAYNPSATGRPPRVVK